MEQVPGPEYAGLMLQLMPEPDGRTSLNVTPFTVPVVFVLETVTVKAMLLPAATVEESAATTTFSAARRTISAEFVVLASADPPPLTVTELTCGDAAFSATLTVTVMSG
jgi:hypothetical protein